MISLAFDEGRYTFPSYLRDRVRYLILALTCTVCLFGMVVLLGASAQGAMACSAFVLLCFLIDFVTEYLRRRTFYRQLEDVARGLERAYYLAALVDRAPFLEGRIFADACRQVCAADARELSYERERSEANQEFVNLWAHEVKTPIAAAKLTLARMHGPESEALRLDVERIESACERILYDTRAASVSQDYELSSVSILRLCQNAIKSLSNLMISTKVVPRFDVDSDLRAMADPSWVKFVIRQVVSNSVKYGASEVRFSAWTEHEGTPQGRVVLQIADDGKGIPSHEVAHVFERGFSGSNGRSEGTSTGMGLYISWKLCESMGVGISLASELGTGTRVVLSFPFDATLSKA